MENKENKVLDNNILSYNPSDDEISTIENLADEYMDRTEEDLFIEIIRVNSEMEKKMSEDQYNAIFEKLESIKPMLNEEQKRKIDRIIDILEKEKK